MAQHLASVSNNFLSSPATVALAEARDDAMRLRTGTLWANKLAFRDKRAQSALCPLCRRADGGAHAALACHATKQQRIARHNAAGRIILRAVTRGTLSEGILMADVGQRRLVPDDPMSLVQARVPAGILPPTPQTGHALTRPDILVQDRGST